MPALGESLTPDKVVQFLSELFGRATFPSTQSREYMAGKRPVILKGIQGVSSYRLSDARLVLRLEVLLLPSCIPQGDPVSQHRVLAA